MRNNIMVTFYIICFLAYPLILTTSFSIYSCMEIDDGKKYLRRDFQIECWTPEHMKMALSIGIPIIIIWVLAFPAFIFIRIKNNKVNLNDKNLLINYGLFYVGLNDEAFFWEIIVSNVRKLIFISCSTFFAQSQIQLKVIKWILMILYRR